MNKPTDNQHTKLWEAFAAKQHDELAPSEQQDFENLRSGFPDEFQSSEQIKSGLGQMLESRKVKPEQSWNSISDQLRRSKVRLLVTNALKYAAVIAVTLLLGYLVQTQFTSNVPEQFAEVRVMPGQIGHVFLFDGTEVWLNSGSQLKYPNQFNTDNRDVYLDGEAFFKVTKNKKLPFHVKTGRVEVEVLGTSFNVSAYKEEQQFAVVLEEGSVKLNQADGAEIARLIPGQMAEIDLSENQLNLKEVDTSQYTNWKDGTLEFHGEELESVFQKLERWYNVEIQIEDPIVRNYQITGTVLRNKPIQQIIQAFEFLAPIRTEYYSHANSKDIIKVYKK